MALYTGQATGWPSPDGGRGNNQLRMAYGRSGRLRSPRRRPLLGDSDRALRHRRDRIGTRGSSPRRSSALRRRPEQSNGQQRALTDSCPLGRRRARLIMRRLRRHSGSAIRPDAGVERTRHAYDWIVATWIAVTDRNRARTSFALLRRRTTPKQPVGAPDLLRRLPSARRGEFVVSQAVATQVKCLPGGRTKSSCAA
jgi:hypothetical protein